MQENQENKAPQAKSMILREIDQVIESFTALVVQIAEDGDARRFADQAVHGAAALAIDASEGRIASTTALEDEITHLWAQLKSVALLAGLELREEAQDWLRGVLHTLTLALKTALVAAAA